MKTYKEAKKEAIEKFEVKYLQGLLKSCAGNVSMVARKSGINRKTIHGKIKEYNIQFEE